MIAGISKIEGHPLVDRKSEKKVVRAREHFQCRRCTRYRIGMFRMKYRWPHMLPGRLAGGETFLSMKIGEAHDPHRDGRMRADARALLPHIKHRVADKFFYEINVLRHVHEENRESPKVQDVKFA